MQRTWKRTQYFAAISIVIVHKMNFIRFTWWVLTLFAKDLRLPPTRRFLHPHPIKLSNDYVTLATHVQMELTRVTSQQI